MVSYDGNTSTGGAVPVNPSPYTAGATVTVANVGSLAKTGSTFAGWNTAANGSGTAYAPAATFTMPGNPVTLYAQWVTCAAGSGAANTCVVGDTGPGGGPVFYANEMAAPGSRYMEAAPSGWNFRTTTEDPELAWTACNYSNGTANSWYLPSRLELNQVCRYAFGDTPNFAATTCTGNGAPVGGFAADFYWSSSQNGPRYTWIQHFGNGYQLVLDKGSTLRVRPVRAF